MSYVEATQWMHYARKRGTLNLGVRVELGFAMLALLIVKALGGRAELRDFMPSTSAWESEDEEEATLEDVMGILMGAKR